jgi:6-phosphofructokinase 1
LFRFAEAASSERRAASGERRAASQRQELLVQLARRSLLAAESGADFRTMTLGFVRPEPGRGTVRPGGRCTFYSGGAPMPMRKIAVLTSGGDAPGMNAAVRAVVRTALARGAEAYGVFEGYQGLVEGGARIRPMAWDSVSNILQKGGTILGTARCAAFRTREGRRAAALNLLGRGIDALVVIGGDGSLMGASTFCDEWSGLLGELVEAGDLDPELAERHPRLLVAGLVGSIDNDLFGTDMAIGADTALHRIIEAVDAIASTAASHQRAFVVKVMGRNCGYLALMGALASGADWVLLPESPPPDGWERKLVEDLRAGRRAGRRDSIVLLAEGARDSAGNPIGSTYVSKILEEGLGEEVRTTVLGHVQRGGAPSAFDRNLGTLCGHAAVETLLADEVPAEPQMIGMRGNRIVRVPLRESLRHNSAVAEAILGRDHDRAMELRGGGFREAHRTMQVLIRALPHDPEPGRRRLRLAILNCGAPAPGMNIAVRTAVRIGADKGHEMFGVPNGFRGLVTGALQPMGWMSVNGWAALGGSQLGTTRHVPSGRELYAVARNLERNAIDGLLLVGGWPAYQAAWSLSRERESYPAFNIPIVCLPASINNNLPGSELSIGSDTALNGIVWAVDRIKHSAGSLRCFVVEVMGRYCGYLALMSGLATGAERVYLHEEGVTLKDLQADVERLVQGFHSGKRLGLMIRNEKANEVYTTQFITSLFEEEGGELFDVRDAILGHLQQGGNPTPFDRIQASRLAVRCIERLVEQAGDVSPSAAFIGLHAGHVQFHDMKELPELVDERFQRPRQQWWMEVRPIARILAQPDPTSRPG